MVLITEAKSAWSGWGSANDKWYFLNSTALTTAYPVWQAGWFAEVWNDALPATIYLRDDESSAWVNTWSVATSDHALLQNLSFTSSWHTGFQAQLISWWNINTINWLSLLSWTDMKLFNLDQSTPQTIIGRQVQQDWLLLWTSPTVWTFVEGKLYYDPIWKTISAEIDTDVTLQIWQEEIRRVYNNSGAKILNGKAVYTTGTYNAWTNDVATIALAKANTYATSQILGLTTQDIENNSYGFVTVRWHINNIDTDAFAAGDVLYLCDVTAWCLTNIQPLSPSLKVRVGRVITKAVAGRVNVRTIPLQRVEDLSDYFGTANDGDYLMREWSSWVPKSWTVSAWAWVNMYLDNITTVDDYLSILRSPNNTTPTQTSSVSVTNTTAFIKWFLYNQIENRTKRDWGAWKFNTFAYVNNSGQVSTIIASVHNVQNFWWTVTVTGTGTSRTYTVSWYTGTPFVAWDANANITLAWYVQTTGWTFQITWYISEDVVTIATPTGYVNESWVAYSVHKYKFQSETADINQTATPILYQHSSFQSDITLKDLTDTIAIRYYGKTTSGTAKTIYLTYNGSTANSYIETPLVSRHNDLAWLNLGDYQHLTPAQLAIVNATSNTNSWDQTITNTSDDTSHTVMLSTSGGSIKFIEGANISLITWGTSSAGTVTIASTGWSGWGFWTAVTATQASTTTCTVATDLTAIFKKWMIVKRQESWVDHIWMVSIPSTYSSPNTTITIIWDTMDATPDAWTFKYCWTEAIIANFAIAGAIWATWTDVANAYYAHQPMRVVWAEIYTGIVASTSWNTVADININGTTCFTAKPTIAYNALSVATPFTADNATALALNDRVTIDIDTVTSTTFPMDLYVKLYLFPTKHLFLT